MKNKTLFGWGGVGRVVGRGEGNIDQSPAVI